MKVFAVAFGLVGAHAYSIPTTTAPTDSYQASPAPAPAPHPYVMSKTEEPTTPEPEPYNMNSTITPTQPYHVDQVAAYAPTPAPAPAPEPCPAKRGYEIKDTGYEPNGTKQPTDTVQPGNGYPQDKVEEPEVLDEVDDTTDSDNEDEHEDEDEDEDDSSADDAEDDDAEPGDLADDEVTLSALSGELQAVNSNSTAHNGAESLVKVGMASALASVIVLLM